MEPIQEPKDSQEENKENVDLDEGFVVDPYSVVNKSGKAIDYDRLIKYFGCARITPDLLARVEALTKRPPHHFLKRDIFFSHRDLNVILNNFEKGKPFFLYTGRGPSSEAMHLGHLMPFIFTKYLQDAFNVPLVIQITDDEKYFHKGEADIDVYTKYGYDNIKDIIACGFDPKKTFIFIDTEYMDVMYKNVCRFQRNITYSQIKGLFGLVESDNSGKIAYPAIQAAPSIASSFPHIFGKRKDVMCLIPQGIDQDPYFRMTRDICIKLKQPKPASIHSKFFPALQGLSGKMSASDPNSAIFLNDTPNNIKKKINSFAFSGGGATLQEHKEKGANLEVDIPYQYLRFFLEDDERLEEIRVKYGKGEMLTSEVKNELIQCLTKIVGDHQERKKNITDEMVKEFMTRKPLIG